MVEGAIFGCAFVFGFLAWSSPIRKWVKIHFVVTVGVLALVAVLTIFYAAGWTVLGTAAWDGPIS